MPNCGTSTNSFPVAPMSFCKPEWGDSSGTIGQVKRKFRWLFNIDNITTTTDTSGDAQPLPCMKVARPKISFKEMQAEHLNETIYFPSKPEWQPIQIMLYDRCITTQNPIFTWLKKQYSPGSASCGQWFPCLDYVSFKTCVILQLLDGCGNTIEAWYLQNCYPKDIDWGDLDMGSQEIVTVEFSLRYDRAFQICPVPDHALYTGATVNGAGCTNYQVL